MELSAALGPDCAGTVLSRLMASARETLDAAVYEVGPSYRWLLVDAARRGARVRLLLDAHASDGNAGTAVDVEAAGGECRVLGSDSRVLHWKLIQVDRRRLAVGTGNLIWRDAPRDPHGRLPPEAPPLRGTREWWLVALDGRRLGRDAGRAFEAAWREATRPPQRWRAAPEESPFAAVGAPIPQVPPLRVRVRAGRVRLVTGAPSVAEVLGAVCAAAQSRIFVTVPYVHAQVAAVRRLLESLGAASRRGADVRLLLGQRPPHRDAERLRGFDLAIRHMDPARSTRGHAKGVIADDTVVAGSANWSAGGLEVNWEAVIEAHHRRIASYYAAAFGRDWEASTPL